MASAYSPPSAFSTGFQLLSALLLWLLLLQSQAAAQNRRDEVRTLVSFKDTNTPSQAGSEVGYWVSWQESDENPCSWIGVTCTANYTVSELDLSDWNLPSHLELSVGMLSNLSDLRHLDLSSNELASIPLDIGRLTGLTLLDLSSNGFFGAGNGGQWESNIPDDIGNLTRLTLLDLSWSGLFGGIPPSISACRSLRSLYLQGNELNLEIASLRGLVKLQILLLADNRFFGPFPQELGELRSLVTLDLSNNFLNGTVPALLNLTKLVRLKLDHNSFTDFERPWFLGANFSVQHLSVSFNQLEGVIPSSIIHLPNLQFLNMSRNRLSGDIPLGLSRQNMLEFSLDLSQNQLTGNLPADLLQQSETKICSSFNLSYNLLTGGIPTVTPNSCFFVLDLSHNNLSGTILWNTFVGVGIFYLWLQNNHLSGDIVDFILQGNGMGSVELKLQNNQFTGDLSTIVNMSIDQQQLNFPAALDLSNNDLRWSTSEAISDPIQATLERLSYSAREFRVGGNNFSGTSIPNTCFLNQTAIALFVTRQATLQVLDLSNSQLNGEIMSAAFNSSCLPDLQFLNLSNNDITGPVPEGIVTPTSLQILDISNNHLSGPLPSLAFNSNLFDTRFVAGNPGLCGYPLDACSGPRSGVQWWLLLVIIGGSLAIAAVLSCLVITWQRRVYTTRHQQDADLIKTLVERDSATLMPLRELRKATDNFADSSQIGQGGFGTVYVGKLNDGSTVAIKRSKREGSEKDKEQFLNEVRILSHVSHRNLVKLIGCCMENKVAVLVFEFVSNGTLQEHLRGKRGAVRLTWKERLNIAVQTADALNYLHSAATFPIYHRDVKSANILLNDDLNAKVADFGISRLAPLHATHVSTVAVQGTFGYIDPEYYTTYQLTDRSDVYSFGVVLLELISAKPALDFLRGGEETGLVHFASPYIERGDLEGLVDPALMETYNDLAGHGTASILSVGRLAVACTDMRSKARPSMNEVLKELQSLWLELTGTSSQVDTVEMDDNELDSVERDDDEETHRDRGILLSESFSGDSSRFQTHGDAHSGIQLSQCSRPPSSKL